MKLTFLFMVIGLMQLSAGVYSQTTRLTLEMRNARVIDVLEQIEKQTEFRFAYSPAMIDLERRVTVNLSEKNIDETLDELFLGTGVKHITRDRHIMLYPQELDNRAEVGIQQQNVVAGKVTDNRNQPLPGVTVVIKGTTIGTITDTNGNYTIGNVPMDATLVFSFVGMKTIEIVVAGKSVINVSLGEETIGIEEVVAVGYGVQRKINLTGSVSIIKADELEEISVPTLSQGIMGRSPGVFIKNKRGTVGGDNNLDLNIRGFGTPLIIVDGTPVTEAFFQQLEPGDIESFNVLKDASAAAVYGARAGNGVIVVTTKRGIEMAPKFNYSGSYGSQFLTYYPDFVSSEQYAQMYNVARMNEGLAPLWTEEEIQKFRDGSDPVNYPNTNWKKESLKQFAPQQQHSISVRGGTEVVKYFTSLNYFQQKDLHVADDVDYKRYSIRSNIDVKVIKKGTLSFDLSLTNRDFIAPSPNDYFRNVNSALWRARPYGANDTHPDPTYLKAVLGGQFTSPYQIGFIENVGYYSYDRLYGYVKVGFDYELPLGFKVKALWDINRTYNRTKQRNLLMKTYDLDAASGQYVMKRSYGGYDYLEQSNSLTKNLNQQYFLTWDRNIEKHQLNGLFVYELLSDNFDIYSASRRDYEFNIDYLFAGPDLNKDNTGRATEGGRKAYISRLNYNYDGKYLIEFSSRWDASPKFPSNTRWGFFPSASVGWRVSEESFIQDNIPILSNLKLRASHGLLGYDGAGAFQYLSTFSIRSNYLTSNGLQSGLREDVLPNPNITWEKMTTTNAGIDFSLWSNGLLDGSIDYFYRLRTDVLGSRVGSVPDVVGASLPQENRYEFDNRGWELVLNHRNKIGDISYSIGGNIATNREKTLFRDQTPFANMEAYRKGNLNGQWTDLRWGRLVDGIFRTQEEIDNWADIDGQGNRSIKPGDLKIVDWNGDGICNADDQVIIGRGFMPKLNYGIDLSVSYKGFNIMALLQGAGWFTYNMAQGGRDFIHPFYSENNPTTFMYNNYYVPDNPWMPDNTNAQWPRYFMDSTGRNHPNYGRNAQIYNVDGAYARLKNLQLGYTFGEAITKKMKCDNLKIYVSGYDLITFHKYKFIDPEIDMDESNPYNAPPIKGIINLGVQIDF